MTFPREQIIAWKNAAKQYATQRTSDSWKWQQFYDERFATLIEQATIERCAKVADRQDGDDEKDPKDCIWSKAARHIASAIRALKEQA